MHLSLLLLPLPLLRAIPGRRVGRLQLLVVVGPGRPPRRITLLSPPSRNHWHCVRCVTAGQSHSSDFVEGVRLIGDEAFRGSQLTEVTLPPSLERVGRYAFAFSRVATTTFVPGASGAYVGAYAFRQCPVARTSVSVLASMPPSIAGRFSRLAFYYEDGRRRSRAAVWGGEIEVVLE